MFKNRVRESRGFTTSASNWETQVTLSSAGWPTEDFGCVLFENGGGAFPSWADGAFTCGFTLTGTNTPTVASVFGGTVSALTNVGGNSWTFTLTVSGNTDFGFEVTNTGGGATNIFAYPAEYPGSTIDDVTQSSSYLPEAIAKYSQLWGIRNMWLSNVPYNIVENTSTTRRTPSNTQAQQGWGNANPSSTEGFPVEWAVYFAKACNIGVWLTLPVWEDGTDNAAGTYTSAVLTMLASVFIPTGLPIVLEIGNELWNSGTYPIGIGVGETLNTLAVNNGFASSDTDYAGVYHYLGYKIHALANACRTAFGSAFGTQVKLVLADQQGDDSWASDMPEALAYMAATYGSVSSDLAYLAIAPYINLAHNSSDTSIADIEADIAAVGVTQPYVDGSEHVSILAQHFGLVLAAYESGWQTNSEANNSYINPAILDSGMEAVMRDDVWKPIIDAGYQGPIMNFESGVSTGATATDNSIADEWTNDYATFVTSGSPRFNALTAINTGGYTPQRNVLTASGQVFEGTNSADNTSGVAVGCSDGFGTIWNNAWEMQFYVPESMVGTYDFAIACTGSAINTDAIVEVNGVTVSSTFVSSSTIDGIALRAGFNYIVIYGGVDGQGASGITKVNSITMTAA